MQADLDECRRRLKAGEALTGFVLAQQDTPHRFQVSQRLYGRESMTDALLRLFEQVGGGASWS